jgi:hypothetical protein
MSVRTIPHLLPTGRVPPRGGVTVDVGHVGAAAIRVVLEPNAELVLLKHPQPLQLRDDQLQGVEFTRPSRLFVHLLLLSTMPAVSPRTGPNPPSCCIPTTLHRFGRTIAKKGAASNRIYERRKKRRHQERRQS